MKSVQYAYDLLLSRLIEQGSNDPETDALTAFARISVEDLLEDRDQQSILLDMLLNGVPAMEKDQLFAYFECAGLEEDQIENAIADLLEY